MRIEEHPILTFSHGAKVTFTFNGQPMEGYEGESIAAALHANGVVELGKSAEIHRPRGFYCAIGNCSSCIMVVNGVSNVKTCITPLKAGMKIETQNGKGTLE